VDYGSWIGTAPGEEKDPVEYVYASDVSVFFNSASATNRPVLNLTPVFTNQTLMAVQLDWLAQDAGPYYLQYCDNLVSNNWVTVQLSALVPPVVLPPVIPSLMQWTDNGTVLLPPLQSPRFYRLLIP
jgi:hypothetical protein